MEKPLTSALTVDPVTAARIEKRAGEIGLTPGEFVASPVRDEDDGDQVDPSVIADLDARWAEIEAGGESR